MALDFERTVAAVAAVLGLGLVIFVFWVMDSIGV